MLFFKYLKNLLCIRVVIELFTLRGLLEIHEYTKYINSRSISDIFYWPEGPCLDMLVIGLFFLDCIILIAEEIRSIRKTNKEYNLEIERELRELMEEEGLSEEQYEDPYDILTM